MHREFAFAKIKGTDIQPVDAFNAALIEAEASEEGAVVSKGTRRALLTLV